MSFMVKTTNKPNNNNNSFWITIATAALSSAATAVGFYYYYHYHYQKTIQQLNQEWHSKRQQERTGRIRAEVKLRELLSSQQQQQSNNNNYYSTTPGLLFIKSIGTIITPYPKRMGTPRQGLLVPSSKGIIQLSKNSPAELLHGIEEYSHVWLLFEFNKNTSLSTSQKTKIRPPRCNNNTSSSNNTKIKVGQLATRSPHRPNPIGLSLVKIEKLDCINKQFHVSGIDLVSNTPIYDIKPYVHWDRPLGDVDHDSFKVPDWVESKTDVLSNVIFTNQAKDALTFAIINDNALAPLYSRIRPSKKERKKLMKKKNYNNNDNNTQSCNQTTTNKNNNDKTAEDDSQQQQEQAMDEMTRMNQPVIKAAMETLQEMLAQDPRSSHVGLKSNQRGTVSTEPYKLLFGNLLQVEFVIDEKGATVLDITKVVENHNIVSDNDGNIEEALPNTTNNNNNEHEKNENEQDAEN